MTQGDFRNVERWLSAADDILRERANDEITKGIQGDLHALIARVVAAKYRAERDAGPLVGGLYSP